MSVRFTGLSCADRQVLEEHPPAKFGVLARLSRGPKRSVLEYVSIGPQRKRSQNPKSAGVVTVKDIGDDLKAPIRSLRVREWRSRSISRPIHPGWLRCFSVTYCSMRHR